MAINITSPGVQFTEKDLSVRANLPAGTSVVVPGFASQGPTTEPILITSVGELESVYGIPTTPAEKYLYYSCREILNSPATLNVIRLPYGVSGGSDYSSSYSGLFYPATLAPVLSTYYSRDTTSYSPTNTAYTSAGYSGSVTIGGAQVNTIVLNTTTYFYSGNLTSASSTLYTQVTSSVDGGVATFGFGAGTAASTFSVSTTASGAYGTIEIQWSANSSGVLSWTATEPLPQTVTTSQSAWTIGAPKPFSFTSEDWAVIQRGDFDWDLPTNDSGLLVQRNNSTNVIEKIGAGIFLLNTLQSTINEVGEGYYVGFSENSAALKGSPNYDSISRIYSLSAAGTFAEIPSSRLDFSLSSTKVAAEVGEDCVSERLEKVGFISYETDDYIDHVSVGVFKVRRSITNDQVLTLGTDEKHLGSLDASRKIASPFGGGLDSAFIEDKINRNSSTVQMYTNPAIARSFQWTKGSSKPAHRVLISDSAKALYPIGTYVPDSRSQDLTKQVGNVALKLDRALRMVDNPEYFNCDVIIDAGISTIGSVSKVQNSSGTVSFDDTTSINSINNVAETWRSLANMFINFAQNTRKDCIALVDPPRSVFVNGKFTKTLDLEGNNFTVNIYNPLRELVGSLESSYAAIYANWIKTLDLFSGNQMWLPITGYIASVIARSDSTGFVWSAPAGLNRGVLGNVTDLAFNPNQKQRDRLYELGLNPVLYFNGIGYAVFGQKTLQSKPSSLDRLNVRRLFLYLQKAVNTVIKYYVFEPNTAFTRTQVNAVLSPVFNSVVNNEGLYDYAIVCDERNNTPDVIDRNEMVVDIYLKPTRTAEFILLNFIATRTSQDFNEII